MLEVLCHGNDEDTDGVRIRNHEKSNNILLFPFFILAGKDRRVGSSPGIDVVSAGNVGIVSISPASLKHHVTNHPPLYTLHIQVSTICEQRPASVRHKI